MRFLTWLVTTAIAVTFAAWIMDGIRFTGATRGTAEIQDKILPLLLVSLILGVVTAFVKPVLTFLSIPFILITLGLFMLVLNVLMLYVTDWLVTAFDIRSFGAGILAAVIVSVVNWGLQPLLPRR